MKEDSCLASLRPIDKQNPIQFDWCTLVRVFAAACALENIALTILVQTEHYHKVSFFKRIETAEIMRSLMEIVACMIVKKVGKFFLKNERKLPLTHTVTKTASAREQD